MKKDSLFDVTMGAHDVREVCELVKFNLNEQKRAYKKHSRNLA